jgi:hypothetical protein
MQKLNFVAVYHLRGISQSPAFDQLPVWNSDSDVAYLTYTLGSSLEQLDRSTAIAHGMMTALFNKPEEDIKAHIVDRVLQIQAERAKKYSSGVFLVFHGIRDVPNLEPEYRRAGHEFDVVYDAIDKPLMQEQFWPGLVRSLAAVSLSLEAQSDPRISKVAAGFYLVDPESGKPTYSYTFTAGQLRVSVGTMVPGTAASRIANYASKLQTEPKLDRVLDQLIQSEAMGVDEFRAFLSAWTGLEILVTSCFARVYQKRWFDLLRGATPQSAEKYFKHVENTMDGRHRLLDKFVVISSLLDPDSAAEDIAIFEELKKIRDRVFHGSEKSKDGFPVQKTQAMLTKFIRLHLDSQ